MTTRTKIITSAIAAILLILFLLPAAGYGATHSTDKVATLTVHCTYDEMPLEGVEFDIYKVADLDENGLFSICPEFEDYNINLNKNDSSEWRALAWTCFSYTQRDGIPPTQSKLTDSYGKAIFNNLSIGLYLVCGNDHIEGNIVYTFEPFLVSLPMTDEFNEFVYDVSVNCKCERNELSDEPIDITVRKIWQDAGMQAVRPQSITAQLLCDGAVFDSVVLDASNGWYHRWEGLNPAHQWLVVEEDVPEGYTLLISHEGGAFILVNSCSESLTDLLVEKIWVDDGNEDKRPHSITVHLLCDGIVVDIVVLSEEAGWSYYWEELEDGHTWTVAEEEIPIGYFASVTQEGAKYYIINTYKPLPQTGLLWWPVPLMVGLGLLCFVAAILIGRKRSA